MRWRGCGDGDALVGGRRRDGADDKEGGSDEEHQQQQRRSRGRFPRPRNGATVGKTMTIGGETLARRRGSDGGDGRQRQRRGSGGGAVNGGEQPRGDASLDRSILDERRDFDELDDVVDSNEVGRPWDVGVGCRVCKSRCERTF
ncbi:hypothetical protein Scep_006591 [Stephania cephalantha]|uniref:Uncharacterized protein n=1 Tax=Stephania cephalantha TaxID=152367 RepID=A0AAP0PMD6_9MAGN